ncbi:MAG TPA: glycoside hydrolase TIM-barrel-like domain-containing protein, partial [Propylenella sp.]|nr:glycoside hydrolase TIM-barrel-like domain-containing protein [Propylenella sp.]
DFDGSNPISPVYSGLMVDPAHLHLWTWDARPYPYFPECEDVWADGPNWQLGHWLNGRLGSVPLASLIEAVLADHEFEDYAIADVHGLVGGYVVNEVLSARATL